MGKYEELPLLATIKQILQKNYVLPRDEISYKDLRRLINFFLPLIIGGIPYAIGSVGYLYITFKRNLWPKPLQPLIYVIQILTGVSTLIIFISNSKNYIISINRMKIYSFGAPRKSKDIIKKCDTLSLILFYLFKIAFIVHALFLHVTGAFCDDPEFKGDEGFICGSYNPLWFPFKVDFTLVHFSIRICAVYVSAAYLPILIILIISPFTTSYLTIIRIRELKKKLLRWNQNMDEKPATREQMIFFVKYHAEIVECIRLLNRSISYDHLPVQLFMPIIMALFMYQIVQTLDVAAVGALIAWFFPYFVVCLLGERLQHESSLLSDVVYCNKWYNIRDKKVKTVYKMMLYAFSQPVKLKLRPLAGLNHLLIIRILKTAYSFLIFFSDTSK